MVDNQGVHFMQGTIPENNPDSLGSTQVPDKYEVNKIGSSPKLGKYEYRLDHH
jgi:hypothetical protein